MKRISILPVLCLLCAALVRAQDAIPAPLSSQEAEENYKSLRGKLQDMIEAQSAYEKRIQALEREVSDLREQLAKPSGNYASQEDVKQLAGTVQEIDRKREADTKHILDEFSRLGKTLAATPAPRPSTKPPVIDSTPTYTPKVDESGFTYQIKAGDNLSTIAQAYKEQQGIRVTVRQILDANPGLNPDKLVIGKKIFIPVPRTITASK
jgi:LysM repeat protein